MGIESTGGSLRLLFSQWQGGGNKPVYVMGSQLLNWLAPESSMPVETVPVDLSANGLEVQAGIFARETVLTQARAARGILNRRRPDRLAILGGDCSVDFAPFAYLNERFRDDIAFIWLDAHPDLVVPDGIHPNFHAMILSALLGYGDPEFLDEVPVKISPNRVLFAGLRAETEFKTALETEHGFTIEVVTVDQIRQSSTPVLDWLAQSGCHHVAIHFDLDVLDTTQFCSTAGPEPGGLFAEEIVRLLTDISNRFNVVGLGITEYMPREALLLAEMLRTLPIIGEPQGTGGSEPPTCRSFNDLLTEARPD